MSLRPNIAELQHHILCKLPLNREVVLRRVLRTQVRLELPVKKDRPEERQIHGLTGLRGNDAVKRIWSRRGPSGLVNERRVKHRVEQRRTASKRRFGAELRQHQFFNRVVE